MVSRKFGLWAACRVWLVATCLALAFFGACSGKSSKDKHSGSSVGGAAGEGAVGIGGSAGDLGEGGEANGGVGGTTTDGTSGVTTSPGFGGFTITAAVTTVSTGGNPIVPGGWVCSVVAYGDGTCDCGCGAPDSDCANHEDIELCQRCDVFGSCGGGTCPAKVYVEDTTRCTPPPEGWTCSPSFYADEAICHCGCGIPDPDCADESVDSCDSCNASGACARGACPSAIDPENNAKCKVPEGWTCTVSVYGDGRCNCGCGVVDMDCKGPGRENCEVCWGGCSIEGCPGPIDQENNAICTGVPAAWTCHDRFYGDGLLCHCGCGMRDPDCDSGEGDACERCNVEGSCSARACPGTINPNDNARCTQPTAPEGWTCSAYLYADGSVCHCGCGVVDLDCPTDGIESCEECSGCGSGACPGRLDPEDVTSCQPLPEKWHCAEHQYADGYLCDCGCGVIDPDCDSPLKSSCEQCYTTLGSCAEYSCNNVLPEDNSRCTDSPPEEWTCDMEFYGDLACDCGCGVRDIDCASGELDACEFCDAEGSCSSNACPGSISDVDNAVCAE